MGKTNDVLDNRRAKKSKLINTIYVTSENDKILKIAKKNKVKVIKRPEKLSKDNTYKIEAIRHAVKKIISDGKKSPSLVVSLQANSPRLFIKILINLLII